MRIKKRKSLKTMARPRAETKRRSAEAKRLQAAPIKMSLLQLMGLGRRKRVDVVALTRNLRLMRLTEGMTVVARVRVAVTAIVETGIGIEAAMIVVIRRKNVEAVKRKKEEIAIERRSVVDGMRMTAETVMQRSVAVNATMLRKSDPLRSLERMTEIGEIATVIVTGIGIGKEVTVLKRRGDEHEAFPAKSRICKSVAITCYRLK